MTSDFRVGSQVRKSIKYLMSRAKNHLTRQVSQKRPNTLPTAEILSGKNVWACVSMVSYLKKLMKIKILKRKKSWEQFRICLLNSTANPAHFHQNQAGLVVLFSSQLLNGSQDFFLFDISISIYFLNTQNMTNPTIVSPVKMEYG